MQLRKRRKSGAKEVKASLAYTICSIIQKGLSFFTLPIFTRLLTVEEYGQCTIYFSWMAIIAIITTLNLPYGTFSRAMVKFEDSRKQYISNVQMICIVLTVFFLIIYLPLREFFNQYLELPTFLVIIMFVEILANLAILCWTGKQRFEYHYKGVIAVTLINSCLTVVSGLLFVLYSAEKGYARIFGYALVTLAIGAGFLIYNFIKGKNPFRKDMWKYALGMNGVLIVYYVSQAIFNQSDRLMISKLIGIEEAAQYGVAYNLAVILTFVIDAINNSYVPWLYGKIKDGKASDNKKISVLLSAFIAFMLLGIIALAPELIYVLAGKQYLDAKWVVPPVTMSLLLLFYSQQFINIEFYYEKKYLLVIASVAAAALNIGLNYWLIPIYGFVAAGYTTLVSYLVFCLCNFLVVLIMMKRRKQKMDFFHVPLLILVFVIFAGLGALATFLYNYSLVRYIIIGVVLLGLLIGLKWIIPYAKKMFPRKEEKMKLRKLQESDAPYMLEWMHDEELCKHMYADFASKTIDDCKQFIQNSESDSRFVHFAIANEADEYMGTVSLKNISYEDGVAEFGIVVRRCAMGKGFSAYGMHEIINYAFRELHLKTVVWCVFDHNDRANRFYQKNNYRQVEEGIPSSVLESYQDVRNLLWYAVNAEEERESN